MNVSIKDDTINNISITTENSVCLAISIFIFSFLLSFTIDLYNLNPLTAKAKIAGIKIIFCSNIEISIKLSPFDSPIILINIDIVYPKQNPLYNIIPKTIGIPYYSSSKEPYS